MTPTLAPTAAQTHTVDGRPQRLSSYGVLGNDRVRRGPSHRGYE